MDESFGEYVAPTDAIRDILRGYPFSIGLLREILQNSDDAHAKKQVLVLDHRNHPSSEIYHPYLENTQGPALLAFNDGILREKDWVALRNIHKSSKTEDNRKIGKFGLGFRSCYHITDMPHILSGTYLAILDPQHHFREDGGVRLNIVENSEQLADHLTAFNSILPKSQWGRDYSGSIFRFPLRTAPSRISNNTTSATEIAELLRDFAHEELALSLLFLRNISSIEIVEITPDHKRTNLAKASISRESFEPYGFDSEYQTRKVIIHTGSSEQEAWRIIHAPFSDAQALQDLSDRLQWSTKRTRRILLEDKLTPAVDLAIPCQLASPSENGRLFTYLPLPLKTCFPVHINAVLSLTQSRQNLRNAGEIGIVADSEDRARVEWNRLLFDTYIPQAWSMLLEVLVQEDKIPNVFGAWPKSQGDVQSGDSMYWKDMPVHVAKHALELDVWPISGTNPPSYQRISSLIVEERSSELEDIVAALVRTGVQITRLPEYLTSIITRNYMSSIKVLSPWIISEKLQSFIPQLESLDDEDARTILTYLLSTSQCDYIVGLPLVPSVSGERVALQQYSFQRAELYFRRTTTTISHVLLDDTEETLFGEYDPDAISLRQMSPSARMVLVNYGCTSLNLIPLGPRQVITYLQQSTYSSQAKGMITPDRIMWLNLFWEWAPSQPAGFLRSADAFFLVPTTNGTHRPTETVFDPGEDVEITHLLETLGILVIDPRLTILAQKTLSNLRPSCAIHSLLRAIPLRVLRYASFSEEDANILCAYLTQYLPEVNDLCDTFYGDPDLFARLRSLPIYPMILAFEDGTPTTHRTSIDSLAIVRGVDLGQLPILPYIHNMVYLNLNLAHPKLLLHLNPTNPTALLASEVHDLMLTNFVTQPPNIQIAFLKYVLDPNFRVPREVLSRLSATSFVMSHTGTLRAPRQLIDPQSPVAGLFPAPSSSLPSLSSPISEIMVGLLRDLELLITRLSMDIVTERIRFINRGKCYDPGEIGHNLIALLNDNYLDFDHQSSNSILCSDFGWIPTHDGVMSPLHCRDLYSHQGKTNLFDEAMPLVEPHLDVGPRLRSLFGWNGEVPTEVILKQLIAVVNGQISPSYQKIFEIVKELGSRKLAEHRLKFLRGALQSRKWVPTQSGTLETSEFALLGFEDIPDIGFHSVGFKQSRYPEVYAFLALMGCSEKPSKETILNHLQCLQRDQFSWPTTQAFIDGVVRLLTWLPKLSKEERNKLFIPNENGQLCAFESVYFNDVGTRATLHELESGSLAHPIISSDLASGLGLQRLGLSDIQNQSDDDLRMDWVPAIRDCLNDYKDSRLLLDLLASAVDAGATEVNILLDEFLGATEALLSPRCHDFQRSTALIVQHNGLFSEKKLKEMVYSCGPGKSNKKACIGQYGVGNIAMFHITELATIISQDQVWFINPCKAHLAVDKAVLRLPLSIVRRSYGDHLSPFLDLFGFSLPEEFRQDYSYSGTIIRLPLRSNNQTIDVDAIFVKLKAISLEAVTSQFKKLAPKCFLFTSLDRITFHDRKQQRRTTVPELRLQWSMNAVRTDVSQLPGDISVNTITISNPTSLIADQEWRIISFDLDSQASPPSLASLRRQYHMKSPSLVYIAARLGQTPDPVHSVFSGLPYPISLDLPVHVSAPFILTADMVSVRLDTEESPGPESIYNHWLLTAMIPKLYLHLLEDRAAVGDNVNYWPGKSKVASEDALSDISTLVGDSVYQMAMREDSSYVIFRSKYASEAHPPRTARFITARLPRAVLAALEATRPKDLVHLSPAVTKKLKDQNSRHFSIVTPKYLYKQLSDHPNQFSASTLEFAQLQELIDFLSGDSDGIGCLTGLNLLPLDDGTFAEFGLASAVPCFHVASSDIHEAAIFKSNRLVHRSLDTTNLLKLGRLNINPIAEGNIKNLINDQVTASETLEGADAEKQRWIRSFWRVFSSLGIRVTAIANYPLIPTLRSTHYLSFNYCKTSAILADFSLQSDLLHPLTQMGLTLVNTVSLPGELRAALPPQPLTVEKVLSKVLSRNSAEISTMFSALDSRARQKFISWIRTDWYIRKRGYFQRHEDYRSLPIWRAANESFVSANEAQMLPKTVTVTSIGPFASKVVVGHDFILVNMGLEPPSSIRSLLSIPPRLEEGQEKAYKNLLLRVLFEFTPDTVAIPVPNAKRMIQDSNTLYSSRDDLFKAAFGSGSEKFIHPSFHQFEDRLEKHGLQRQHHLSLSMFRVCVEAFHAVSGGSDEKEMKERADELVWFWGDELPECLTTLNQDQLSTLDDFRFVPRLMAPRPLGSKDDTRYMRSLPAIVSPNELVRAEYQAVAWSQRALYKPKGQPHPDLVKMHRNLSVPTAQEVVNHLVVLATKVASDVDKSCRNTLLDHLEQTYGWLNKNIDDAKPFLQKCKTDELPIFLNTEVPQLTETKDWNWKRVDHILLNSDSDREYLQYPRSFIKKYQPLLVAAGAVSIDYGKEVKPSVELPASEDRYASLCSTLNRMRKNGVCTDVKFSFDSTKEEPLFAHRTYLAAYSSYFMDLFSKPETTDARFSVVPVDCAYSKGSVETLLDYVYTSQEPELKNADDPGSCVKLAVEILALSHLWQMTDAQQIVQSLIITQKMVDPFNLETIRSVAQRTKSKELMDHCEYFAERNAPLIQSIKKKEMSVNPGVALPS